MEDEGEKILDTSVALTEHESIFDTETTTGKVVWAGIIGTVVAGLGYMMLRKRE